MMVKILIGKVWFPVFEEDLTEEEKAAAEEAARIAAEAGKAGSFSQEQVNKLLAEEKRKGQSRTQKALEELEALKGKADLSSKDRSDLENRIEILNNEMLTKEELSKKDKDKILKQHEKSIMDISTERDTWRQRFTQSTIQRTITDAAAANEAFVPAQIVALLQPKTRLIEALDSEGKPTGNLIPKVEFEDSDKDGKPIILDITVPEAVKRMKEQEIHGNLFKGAGTGGVGGTNHGKGGNVDLKTIAKDPAEYRRLRKEGKLPFNG